MPQKGDLAYCLHARDFDQSFVVTNGSALVNQSRHWREQLNRKDQIIRRNPTCRVLPSQRGMPQTRNGSERFPTFLLAKQIVLTVFH